MKKIFPILFVASTSLIAVLGVCGSFNDSFRELHAEEHEHTVTFTSSNITNPSSSKSYYDSASFSFSKKTQSGFDFGATATVTGGKITVKSSDRMVEVEDDNGFYDDFGIQMTFEFHNVSSAVSVVLNGNIDHSNSKTYTNATTISDGYKIAINEVLEEGFYINTIVVKYTCSY